MDCGGRSGGGKAGEGGGSPGGGARLLGLEEIAMLGARRFGYGALGTVRWGKGRGMTCGAGWPEGGDGGREVRVSG